MGFLESEETGRMRKDVDEFLRSTLEHNKDVGASLAATLGSFMLPGAMGVKGGGPGKYRPRISGPPKSYTTTESGNLSKFLKSPKTRPGTAGKGEGYGIHRRSPEYSAKKIARPTDPGEYLADKASKHFNQLTPVERMKGDFEDWTDLYEVWQMRFDAGQKSSLPPDVYNMFSKMLKGKQGTTGTRNFIKEAMEGDPKRSMTKQALDLGREIFEGKVNPKELKASHETFKSMWKDNPDLVMRNQYFTEAFEFAEILGGKTAGKEGKIKLMQMSGDLPKDFGF